MNGIVQLRLFARSSLLSIDPPNFVHKHSDKVFLLKYHPLFIVLLSQICYKDAYEEDGNETFKQLE